MRQPKRFKESNRFQSQKKYKEQIDKRFGSLTVLSFPGYIKRVDSNKGVIPAVKVECDCGNVIITNWYNVKNGRVPTCGCQHSLYHSDPTQGSCNDLMVKYKQSAKKRGLIFDLDYKTFRCITSQNCSYCNVEPSQIRYPKNCQAPYVYNGIDRIDNSKGYIKGNVTSCCKICNRSKSDMHLTEWYEYLGRISRIHSPQDKHRAKTVKAEMPIPC